MQVDFLKKRAEEFLTTAKYHLKKQMYHLAAFDLEQACQFYLKYYLFLKLKDFPKTHSLTRLLKDVGRTYGKEKEVKKLIKENIDPITDLEQAYLTSRYLPVEFYPDQVKKMEKFIDKLVGFLKQL